MMRSVVIGLAGIVGVAASGCSGDAPATYQVSGVARYQGQPLHHGHLMFVPDEGPAVTAPIHSDGRYELSTVAGRHFVAIRAGTTKGGSPEEKLDTLSTAADIITLPAMYDRHDTSTIVYEVKPGLENSFDIDLK